MIMFGSDRVIELDCTFLEPTAEGQAPLELGHVAVAALQTPRGPLFQFSATRPAAGPGACLHPPAMDQDYYHFD